VVPGDITDRKTAERAISQGVARFGRIDTLLNNAGIFIANRSQSTPRPITAHRAHSWKTPCQKAVTNHDLADIPLP
jgi:NADP-dependent 3-hydroxy acid dehydrogenase YdfG